MSGMDDMSSTSGGSMTMKMYMHGSIGTDMLWFDSWMPTSAGATVGVCVGLFVLAVLDRYLAAFRRACDASWNKGHIGFVLPVTNGTFSIPSSTSSPSSPSPPRRSSTQKLGTPTADVDLERGESSAAAPLYSQTDVGVPPCASSPSSSAALRGLDDKHAHLPCAVRRNLARTRDGQWARPFLFTVDAPRGLLHALQVLIHYLLMLVVMTFQIWWIVAVVVGAGVGECLFGRFGAGASDAFSHSH
ncbi:hypothetical protein Q5752_004037 [Cryptotrichosporon argae]